MCNNWRVLVARREKKTYQPYITFFIFIKTLTHHDDDFALDMKFLYDRVDSLVTSSNTPHTF